MAWKLWLDDIRNPKLWLRGHLNQNWEKEKYVWALSVEQAQYFVKLYGPPTFMVLDHDLGFHAGVIGATPSTVMEFLKWLADKYPDSAPDYSVISANPVGAENIVSYMESWKKVRGAPVGD